MNPHKPIGRLTQYYRFATFQISPAVLVEACAVVLILSSLLYLWLSCLLGLGWMIFPLLSFLYLTKHYIEGDTYLPKAGS